MKPFPCPTDPEPFSRSLERLLSDPASRDNLTANQLLESTSGRGLYLVMILLCVPFAIPFSIPGASGLLGSIVFFLAIRLALGLPAQLPVCIGCRPLPLGRRPQATQRGLKFLRFIERWATPRHSSWMGWRLVRGGHAILIAWMAFLLALPLPIPLTNTLPGYAIILLAASMMEGDGILVWYGYVVAAGTTVYFAFWANAATSMLHRHFEQLMNLLGVHP